MLVQHSKDLHSTCLQGLALVAQLLGQVTLLQERAMVEGRMGRGLFMSRGQGLRDVASASSWPRVCGRVSIGG